MGARQQAQLQVAQAAAELLEGLLRLNAELLKQTSVLLVIDLVGKFLLGLLCLVAANAALNERDDLVFGDLHGFGSLL
jgi:hypothetical protein